VTPDLKEEYLKKHKKTGEVCFGGLPDLVKKINDANRLIYHIEIPPDSYSRMTDDQRSGWIKLLKKHKMLPNYVSENAVHLLNEEISKGTSYKKKIVKAEGFYLLDIVDAPQSMVYIWLTLLRSQRENYGIPIVTQFLVSKNMDFYLALCFGHCCGSGGAGHAILDFTNGPLRYARYEYESETFPKFLIPIHKVNGLVRFLRDPCRYDTRLLKNGGGWKCYPIINNVNKSKKRIAIDIVDAFNEHIIKAVHAEDDAEYERHVKAFMVSTVNKEKESTKKRVKESDSLQIIKL
jgi:hypothetical protein